ncbi:MYND-type domain-containing protein [Mycena sanguinolenta]|uniref:MYND-type domain-containing protein n=1 Tax=Mycena sanguinolenta TaxID=230812 RepID=A0A8H7D9U1_9AGAR|nr:MYND-type domain-containing protein [Mycena sanguinolenta]
MIFQFALLKNKSSQQELGSTLWPRVWPWMRFMHEHREYLPGPLALENVIYFQFLGFVEQNFFPLHSPVTSTPGFRAILATAWVLLPEMKSSKDGFQICSHSVALFLRELDFTDPVHFMEMVDSTGGRLEGLACLSTEFLDHAVDLRDYADGRHSMMCVDSLMAFILGLGDSLRENFLAVLRKHFLSLLPTIMDVLIHTAPPDSASVWCRMFDLLEQLLYTPQVCRLLLVAIRAGLLRTMATLSLQFPGNLDYNLRYLLTKLLPENLVYYNLVAAIGEILQDLTEFCYREEFEALEIFDDWVQFLHLAEMRVKVMRGLAGAEALKVCDNVECGEIRDRSQCRRCSGCNSFYYCNRQCQMADWRRGSHRNNCGSNMMLSLGDSRNCTLGFHERQFMRALVQDDYIGEINSIYKQHLELMAADPDALILTLFDYTYTTVQISVHSIADSPFTDTLNSMGTEWTDMVSRAKRSHGCMQLHVIKVSEGIDTRLWVTPLRTSSSQIYDAVRELAKNLPADYDEELFADAVNRVTKILDYVDDANVVVEIH